MLWVGRYRLTIGLGAVGLLAVILLATRPEEISVRQPVAPTAELDTPAEQVRVLTSELVQRDRRLEDLEQGLRALQNNTRRAVPLPKNADTQPQPEPITASAAAGDQVPPVDEQWSEVRQMLQDIGRQLATLRADSENNPDKFGENIAIISDIAGKDEWQASDYAAEPAPRPLVWHGTDFEQIGEPPPPDNRWPRLLIPPGTTIGRLRLITSLIGRIPTANQVISPLPFKALVEAGAIAAPGFALAELRGAVVSGEAVGDLLLNCVRARITGIVLIVEDGYYARAGAAEGESLGYLSDSLGNPCLRGQLVTDFPRALLASGLAKGLEVSASALAQQQQRSQLNPDGSFEVFSGDSGDFIAGTALAGSAASLGEWIRQRAADSFDAVTVQSGGLAVAHITREIELVQDGRRIGWQFAAQER